MDKNLCCEEALSQSKYAVMTSQDPLLLFCGNQGHGFIFADKRVMRLTSCCAIQSWGMNGMGKKINTLSLFHHVHSVMYKRLKI